MRDPNILLMEAQARQITRLNDAITSRDEKIFLMQRALSTASERASYYEQIEKICAENPTVASQWKRFVGIMRLAVDEQIPGITKEKDEYHD